MNACAECAHCKVTIYPETRYEPQEIDAECIYDMNNFDYNAEVNEGCYKYECFDPYDRFFRKDDL